MVKGDAKDATGGVPEGDALVRFLKAVLSDPGAIAEAREALVERVGPSATVHAACVTAAFDGINRVADATGIRLDESTEASTGEMVEDLDFEALRTA